MIDDKPLLRSSVGNELWDLLKTDPTTFKKRVQQYFAIGYHGWRVVRADTKTKTIYLKDERIRENAR